MNEKDIWLDNDHNPSTKVIHTGDIAGSSQQQSSAGTDVETAAFKGRSGKSRQIALDHYRRHECVFCELASDVLEVAHLDMNQSNDAVENLALMCPTCHRMHDVDLIPTKVVRTLRDQILNDGQSNPGNVGSGCSFCKRPLRKKLHLIQVSDVTVQLCPCCAERHELGILKSELILLMHRANKDPNWSKLMKDAGKKASIQRDIGVLKTKYIQSKNPAVKANLTRKIQPLEKKKASLR